MKNIAVFASGSGTNAAKLIEHFNHTPSKIQIKVVISNNAAAGVIDKAQNAKVKTKVFTNIDFSKADVVIEYLKSEKIDWIVLAGFLRKISPKIINEYPNRIINIHPALLPKYGGKGMYGNNVHKAVVAAGETRTGITIHLVNEAYDKGEVLFQTTCQLSREDNAASVAKKVRRLEHQYFPKIVEETIKSTHYED